MSKLTRNIPEFQKLIIVEGFIDSIMAFFGNNDNVEVSRLIATIAFYVNGTQLLPKVNESIIRTLIVLLSKAVDELFYLVLKSIRRNMRFTTNSILIKIIEKMFSLWE